MLLEQRVELRDTPGSEDADPLRDVELGRELQAADHVVCVLPKDMCASKETAKLIKEYVVPRLAFPSSCQLNLLTVLRRHDLHSKGKAQREGS